MKNILKDKTLDFITDNPPNLLSLIDFCKGLAISWVFFFHYSKNWFGWQGVHIFIVLSGFGLTYSCLKRQGNISWRQWYVKRSARILPAYWLVSLFGFLFLIGMNLRQDDVLANTGKSLLRLLLDLSLLRNFSYQTIFNYPNDQLWFVPLIFSLYLIFPLLYTLLTKCKRVESYLLLLLGAVAIEFIYRAISIYRLDGAPIGFQVPLLNLKFPLQPLNAIPDNFLFPFQLQAPFGIFPARIGEFMLGMMAAVLLVKSRHNFNKIFSNSVVILSVATWLIGSTLVYSNLLGWVFASFFIALGLTLWTINLALVCQKKLPFFFSMLSKIGNLSYYIFLTHSIFIYILDFNVFNNIAENIAKTSMISFLLFRMFSLVAIITATAISSWLLMQFDNSKFSKLLLKKVLPQYLT